MIVVTRIKFKLYKLLVYLIGYPVTMIFNLTGFSRRVSIIRVDIKRIGSTLGFYFNICENEYSDPNRFKIHFFNYDFGSSCNIFWKNKIKKGRFFIPEFLGLPVWRFLEATSKENAIYSFPVYGQGQYATASLNQATFERLQTNSADVFGFTAEEEKFGKNLTQKLGIDIQNSICFANRDSSYLEQLLPDQNMNHHNYRNFSIQDYCDGIKYLTKKNYSVLRMGSNVAERFNFEGKNIIDYADSDVQSDFLDIYLMAKCKYGVYADGGISAISEIYRRPILYINYTGFTNLPSWTQFGRVIFKKFKDISTGKYVSYHDIFNTFPVHELLSSGKWEEYGIEIVDNCRQEILEAIIEMDATVNGCFEMNELDYYLQNKFWDIFGNTVRVGDNFKVASSFLRSNKGLLEANG
jgi:putative glycosyltransferase (TIGR04372 family)